MKILTITIFIFTCLNSFASLIKIDQSTSNLNLTPNILISRTKKDSLPTTYNEVKNNTINIDYTYDDIWIKFTLSNNSNQETNKYLYYYFGTPDDIALYADDKFESFGNWTLQKNKPIDSVRPVYKINLKANEEREFIFRRRGQERFDGKLLILNENEFVRIENFLKFSTVLYIGSSITLLFFNLLFLIQTRMFANVYYCLFNFFYLCTTLSWTGLWSYFNLDFFGLSLVKLNPFVCGLIVIFGSFFTNEVLYKDKRIIASRITLGTAYFSMATIIFMFFFGEQLVNPYFTVYQTMDICLSWFILSALSLSVLNLKKVAYAKFYLMSWSFNFVGGFFYFITYFGIFETNYAVALLMVGNVMETVLFSFTLSFRYKAILIEKEYVSKELENYIRYKVLYNSLFHDVRNKIHILIRRSETLIANFSIDRAEKVHKLSKDIQKHISSLELKSEENIFISLKQCIHENTSLLEEIIQDKQIVINLSGNIDTEIEINREILSKSIIFNLLSNAIKFSPTLGKIEIIGEQDQNYFKITIKDQGRGIPEDILNKINEKKVVSTIGTHGEIGTGLGLNIVKSFIELYGGFLNIITSQTEGTSMVAYIPILNKKPPS